MRRILFIIVFSLFHHLSIFGHQDSIPLQERPDQLIHLGHGIQKSGSLSHEEIDLLKAKYRHHKILNYAFSIMEGADLAISHDTNYLLKSIKKRPVFVSKKDLLTIMEKENNIIIESLDYFNRGDDPETMYRPLLDMLSILGAQSYATIHVNKEGIKHAIELIKTYGDMLISAKVPAAIKDSTGNGALYLRIALFYIDCFKRKLMNQKEIDLQHLKSFYSTTYFGHNTKLEKLLMRTIFYQEGKFYTPSNGYIKNADVSKLILQNGLTRPLIFSDCSGFIQAITRKFHLQNNFLQKRRLMSYHLAPIYDYLANKKMDSADEFYDIDGQQRHLTYKEKNKVSKFEPIIKDLTDVYEPIINPIKHIKSGDIIIQRGKGEGHVMLAVEQSSRDPYLITVIELTSFKGNGFNWTQKKLTTADNDGKIYRVLRIK